MMKPFNGRTFSYLLTFMLMLLGGLLHGQTMHNWAAPEIRSIKCHRAGDPLSQPIVRLDTDDALTLEFDNLADDDLLLDYTITHCSPTWEPTGLLYHEYATGFEVNSLAPGRSSQGTTPLYTHHTLTLPNDDVAWRLSGNYVLRVFDRYNPERTLLQRQFRVLDQRINPMAQVLQPSHGKQRTAGQRLELDIDYAKLGSQAAPFTNMLVTITQNHQHYNAKVDAKPTFVGNMRASYSHPDSLLFDGGNEYRNLVYRSQNYRSQQIAQTRRMGGELHIALAPDEPRLHPAYAEQSDLNGQFALPCDDCHEPAYEGQYAWFYFTLPTAELPNTDVVLYLGEADGGNINPHNQLRYSAIDQAYETRLLLKQGIYSYRYLSIDRITGRISPLPFEGNHYAAENTYQVYVYHRPIGERYWQLVGFGEVRSR